MSIVLLVVYCFAVAMVLIGISFHEELLHEKRPKPLGTIAAKDDRARRARKLPHAA